jgi:hypothetical protein
LDQLIARKVRYSTAKVAGWNATLLENPLNNYFWQPETLNYTDILTGSEIWMLTRAPDAQEYTSKEHGVNAWSADGSVLGFFSANRTTNNPKIIKDYHQRWLVNSDGSKLRVALGYGRKLDGLDGFSWAHTENAYFTNGSGGGDQTPSTGNKIYKNTVGTNNIVSGALVIDTSSINAYAKYPIKDAVSQDDKSLVFRDQTNHISGAPNNIANSEMYFITLSGTPAVTAHWGIARGIGPSPGTNPYGTHIQSAEDHCHDAWAPGFQNWIMCDYSGTSDIFVTLDKSGSSIDGGPAWSDWNGSGFGEIRVESDGTSGTPHNPYGVVYFGHPAFDRWGRYAVFGDTDSAEANAGTRIWDSTTHTTLLNYMMRGQYDGQHHSMNGWADYVAMIDPATTDLYTNALTGNENTRTKLASIHYPGRGRILNYIGYPRPSISPDGTKVQYHMDWIGTANDNFPNIAYATAYYPYPPEIKSAVKSGANVRLTWDFNQGTATHPNYSNPRTYTKRGWPNETTDRPSPPREIDKFRFWVSADNISWVPVGSTAYNNCRGQNKCGIWTEASWTCDVAQAVSSTRYYAVTSLEHSGLESHTLSNVWKVTTDSSGNITQQLEQSAYPANPGGKLNFYPKKPGSPTDVISTHKLAPAIASGQYTITWKAPHDKSYVRFYNIYALDGSDPTPIPQRRIASIPATSDYTGSGSYKFVDWLGAADGTTKYVVTAVDFQGNESVTYVGAPTVPTGFNKN